MKDKVSAATSGLAVMVEMVFVGGGLSSSSYLYINRRRRGIGRCRQGEVDGHGLHLASHQSNMLVEQCGPCAPVPLGLSHHEP
jgi:hypothetical protein